MRYRVLGCYGGEAPGYHLSSFLVDDTLLIDAGSVTSTLEIPAQSRIDTVLLTHSHLDHVRGLAHLADNMFGRRVEPIGVYSVESVLEGLKISLLNNILWPDFTEIPDTHTPILDFRSLPEGKATRLGPWRVTPIRLSHTVVSVGYLIEGESGAILHLGDTGPTEEVWFFAKKVQALKAVMIEATFPNRLQHLANISGHLTPRTLQAELAKASLGVQVYAYHMKPQYEQEVIHELKELVPECRLLEQGREYWF